MLGIAPVSRADSTPAMRPQPLRSFGGQGGPGRARSLLAGVLTAGLALAAAGCSAGNPAPSAAPSPAPRASSPRAAAKPVASKPGSTMPALPAPATTGKLHVLLHDAFPVTSNGFPGAIGTEAPDGAVFATFGTVQGDLAAAPAGAAIYVIDGDSRVQVAEHPAVPVTALAADEASLYVGGGSEIIEYARSTGAIVRTWNLALPVRLMALGGGRLWAVLGKDSGPWQVAEITPDASAVTVAGTDAATVTSIAAGPLGLYYVEAGGATIVHISPDGTRHEAPTHQQVNEQLSGQAAVQAISVIGNRLYVVHDAGQGLDSASQTYDASTLAGPLTNAAGSAGSNHAIDSLAGPVDVCRPGTLACGATSSVGRYNLASGAVTDTVAYPQGTVLGPLLGPYPAVFVFPPSGYVYLDRIG